MPDTPWVGPSYSLASKPGSVQRTVNMTPVPIEPGNERVGWVFKDVPGLVKVITTAPVTTFIYAPLSIYPWKTGDGGRPVHSRDPMKFHAGYSTTFQDFDDYATAVNYNASVARFFGSGTSAFSKTYIGYATAEGLTPGALPIPYTGIPFTGAIPYTDNQYLYYCLAYELPTNITVTQPKSDTYPFPHSGLYCGNMWYAGAVADNGVVYWPTDGTDDQNAGSYITKALLSADSQPGAGEPYYFNNNCVGFDVSTTSIGNYIIRMRAERMPALPADSITTTWSVLTTTAKQLTANEYRSGQLYQTAIGPVLLPDHPSYNDSAYWASQAGLAIASGKMKADVTYPVVVATVAQGAQML